MFSLQERLYVLPCDHRDILRGLWVQHQTAGYADADSFAAAAKEAVVDGLLLAIDAGVPARSSAVLMDDELGAPALAKAQRSGVARILPVDTGEVGPFTLQHPGRIDEHVRSVDPEMAACLIGYNPEAENAAEQLERTRELAEWQPRSGVAFLLELQVLPRPEDLGDDGGATWERERRPALIVQAISDLRGVGFDPQVWKLQDVGLSENYAAVSEAVTEHDRQDVRIVVLGAGAEPAVIDEWLTQAASHSVCIGFAIGRSVWAPAIESLARGEGDSAAAARRIADNYRYFVNSFDSARDRAATLK